MTAAATYLERKVAAALSREPTPIETALLIKYVNLLRKWQKTQRLIGSEDPAWIVDNVLVDSLLFKRALPVGVASIADVGSGAGVPGIPLAVVMPTAKVTLIESRQKRGSFLAAAIRELPLRNVRLVVSRLELVQEPLRFDAVVMRCAGSPTALLPQLRRILAPAGVIVASGPPRRVDVDAGDWLEIEGPHGPRRFWVYHAT